MTAAQQSGVAPTNWAGNITFAAARSHAPASVAELQQIVAASTKVRTLGSGHSFNRIADTTGDLVSVANLPSVIEIDSDRKSVTVSAGTRYGELGKHLQANGFALHNTGSLPHISIAGASSTGTHGSGNGNGNLATIVSAIELVTAEGELVTASRETNGDQFNGMVLALGSLGVITSMTLDIVPTFDVRQDVYEDLPREQLDAHFEEIMADAYSVSLFTDWKTPAFGKVWRKRRVAADDRSAADPTWFDAVLATRAHNPVPGMSADNTTAQLGVPGPWNERLPHFRLDFMPSSGEEIQSEYLLPRQHAVPALQALGDIADRIASILQISEIRTIAGDDLWISPSYHTDSVAFHFTWILDEAAISPVLIDMEERLAPFQARPHWGKAFHTSPEKLAELYPRLPDFRKLLLDFDPAGKFRNEFVDRLILGGTQA